MGGKFSRSDQGEPRRSSNDDNRTESSEKDTLLQNWNIAAASTVLSPVYLFLLARLVNRFRNGEGGGGEEGEGWWANFWGGNDGEGRGWRWWGNGEDDRREGGGKMAIVFVYFWTLVLFGILVWRGNRVLDLKKDYRALFAALVVFANLAFLCFILMVGFGRQEEEQADDQPGWLGQFSSVMILTFIFWTIFAAVFATILLGKVRKVKSSGWNSGRSSDYQRQDDNGGII